MRTNGYFVRSIVALSLVGTLALAQSDHETQDQGAKIFNMKSSIQMKQNATEADEQQSAKLGAKDVMSAVNAKFSGKITNIKLENIDGNLVYRAEVLNHNNTTTNIFIDAGNGKILASKIDKKDSMDEEDRDQENSDS